MRMRLNRQVEDYLKTIYHLRENDAVRGVDIVRALGVTKPTVSVALRKLENAGLITVNSDRSLSLTKEGEMIARDVTQRYDTIYGLLTDLGVDKSVAHEDSCRMEHGISEASLQALIELRRYLIKTGRSPSSQSLNEEA